MSELTSVEERWVKRSKKLFKDKPEKLRLLLLDDSLYVCKDGVPSIDYADNITSDITATNGITEHD